MQLYLKRQEQSQTDCWVIYIMSTVQNFSWCDNNPQAQVCLLTQNGLCDILFYGANQVDEREACVHPMGFTLPQLFQMYCIPIMTYFMFNVTNSCNPIVSIENSCSNLLNYIAGLNDHNSSSYNYFYLPGGIEGSQWLTSIMASFTIVLMSAGVVLICIWFVCCMPWSRTRVYIRKDCECLGSQYEAETRR